jgi:WD40 repeat protein/DNA-binding SARP family transcriptional activator
MRFLVLGPLEVEADDGPVALGGPKERLLLALLLTRPNQVVSVEALIEGLWRDRPPPTAAKTLQSHVLRVRRALEPGRPRGAAGEVLVTREPGYLLRVSPGELDTAQFEALTARARRALVDGQATAAAASLQQALELWRGQAFGEFLDCDLAAAEAGRLGELRLVAVEDRVDTDLRLGRHRELVAELEGLAREHPLRERLWVQLMLALYRSGRQADALLAYQRARSVLVEELGIDPGAELRQLHTAVLAQDPGLDLPVPAAASPARELPEALHPAGPPFVGRVAELAWLQAAWTRAARGEGGAVFVAGAKGIGKTRLAAEFARQVHDLGGWVLYSRSTVTSQDPLQPLTSRTDSAALLVVDDLHLGDAAALERLADLAVATAGRRLLLLGLYRDDTGVATEVTDLVQRQDRTGASLRWLGPLEPDEVAQVLALYGNERAARSAADEVRKRTGGVPVLVHQAAGDWAQNRTSDRLEETARRAETTRSTLRTVQSKLADDVVDLQELREHTQHVARLATDSGSVEEPDGQPASAVCPYKGLARFEPADAGFFFGRERLVAGLVSQVVGAGLVGVVGPSGGGKSSLVRAGLLPALAAGVLPGSERWRQVIVRPGDHPMLELDRAAGPEPGGSESAVGAGAGHLLLVVDQFEEVFTTCRDAEERAAFLAALSEAAQAPEHRVTVVVVVRADYYGHVAAAPRLASLLAANHVLVGPMDPDELRRAVELPARRAGLLLEPGLAEAMIAEMTDEPGGLPLLSCALLEGWEHRRGRTLTLAAYHQTGGVRGAVARLAERAWRQLDPADQEVARRVLLRLAGPGEGDAVVRRRVPLSEFTSAADERGQAVLEALADHRLLTKGEDTVEVAHEALLREWPRLRGWLEEDAQGRTLHRHLIGAAREWDQVDRDPGELYRGARLTGTLDWARGHPDDLNQLERDFLDASRAATEREVDDARRRADREARTSRRLRGLLAGLAGVLVLALVAGGLALDLRGRAERDALVAQSRRLGALALTEDELDRSLLLARQGIAFDDSLETRGDLLAALLRSPAATAVIRGPVGGRLDGMSALGLSRDGRLLAVGDADGTVSIFDTRTHRPISRDFQAQDQVTDLKFSPDGSLLAITTTELTDPVWLWDVRVARVRRKLARRGQPDASIEARYVEFSADGRTLVALTGDTTKRPGFGNAYLTRWEVASGHRLQGPVLVSRHGGDVMAAAPDGARLVVVNGAEVLVESARTFRRLRRFPHDIEEPQTFVASLSPADGRTLALGSSDGWAEFLDLETGRRRRTIGQHASAIYSIRFSPDGRTLGTGSTDLTVKLWDVASGQLRETLQGHEGRVGALHFSRHGETLYSSGSKNVIAWDLEGSHRLGRPFPFAGPPPTTVNCGSSFAISPDGSLLATPAGTQADHVTLRSFLSPRRVLRSLAPGVGQVSALAFSPDGTRLAVASEGTADPVLVDVASGKVLRRLTGRHFDGSCSIRFSPSGQQLATGSPSPHPRATVWDVTTGRPIHDFPRPGDSDVQVAWSPNGSMLAAAGAMGQVAVWRTTDWKLLATLQADTSWAIAAAFSPDSSLLAASGLASRGVTLWSTTTWKAEGHLSSPAFIPSLDFARRGATLATSDVDDNVRLWDSASLRQIGSPLPGPQCGQCLSVAGFDPSGTHLVVLYDNGVGLTWDTDPELWKQRACAVAGRTLTRDEWQELVPGRRYQPACR